MRYLDFLFYAFDDNFVLQNNLIPIGLDSTGWRKFYSNKESNWIVFYPFSEYHGGGQPFIINIEERDFEDWLFCNTKFEEDIRDLIDK